MVALAPTQGDAKQATAGTGRTTRDPSSPTHPRKLLACRTAKGPPFTQQREARHVWPAGPLSFGIFSRFWFLRGLQALMACEVQAAR